VEGYRDLLEKFYGLKRKVRVIPERELSESEDWRNYGDTYSRISGLVLTGKEIIEEGIGDFTEEQLEHDKIKSKLEDIGKVVRGKSGEFVEKINKIIDS